MGLSFFKRVPIKKGLGLNVSGTGLSGSYRSKLGSIGTKGFSLRSGIPGINFRKRWLGAKNYGNGAIFILIILASLSLWYLAAVVVYNLIRFIFWVIIALSHLILGLYFRWKDKQLS